MTQAADGASLSVNMDTFSKKKKSLLHFLLKIPFLLLGSGALKDHTKFFSAWPIRGTENSVLIIS